MQMIPAVDPPISQRLRLADGTRILLVWEHDVFDQATQTHTSVPVPAYRAHWPAYSCRRARAYLGDTRQPAQEVGEALLQVMDGRGGELASLWIRPDQQRKGLGTALLRFVRTCLRRGSGYWYEVTADVCSLGALRLLARVFGGATGCWQTYDCTWADVQRLLPAESPQDTVGRVGFEVPATFVGVAFRVQRRVSERQARLLGGIPASVLLASSAAPVAVV